MWVTAIALFNFFIQNKLVHDRAVLIVLCILTLPSFQIIVGNGAWLAPSLAASIWSGAWYFDKIFNQQQKNRDALLFFIITIAVLSTYQSIAFLSFIPPLISLLFNAGDDFGEIRKIV